MERSVSGFTRADIPNSEKKPFKLMERTISSFRREPFQVCSGFAFQASTVKTFQLLEGNLFSFWSKAFQASVEKPLKLLKRVLSKFLREAFLSQAFGELPFKLWRKAFQASEVKPFKLLERSLSSF